MSADVLHIFIDAAFDRMPDHVGHRAFFYEKAEEIVAGFSRANHLPVGGYTILCNGEPIAGAHYSEPKKFFDDERR